MSVNDKIIKTFTFEVQPHNEKLLDQLMERYVLTILRTNTEANIVQGSIPRKTSSEDELSTVFKFLGMQLPPII